MKNGILKSIVSVFLSAAVLTGLSSASEGNLRQDDVNLLTPSGHFAVCGLKGSPVSFSAKGFEQQLGLESGSLSGIIVTSLPDVEQGRLKINGQDVQQFETIGRDGLNRLSFSPKTGCTASRFCFVPLVPGQDEKCSEMCIALLDQANESPKAEGGAVSTLENVAVTGSFRVTDEDEDSLTVKIDEKPRKGGLTVNGLNYTYEPYLGMTGNDSFMFTAVDRYGCASETVSMSITIEKSMGSFSYADMQDDPDQYAALKLAQQGLVTGEKIGKSYLFWPKESITKGDFLVMLLSVAGRDENLAATVNTGLKNDSSIPMWMKPYVECAKRFGIIGGHVCSAEFDSAAPVTKTEAVCMIQNAAQFSDSDVSSAVFRDINAIPSWAVQPFINLYQNDILVLSNGCAGPNDKITRGDAAGLLWRLKCSLSGKEKDSELD